MNKKVLAGISTGIVLAGGGVFGADKAIDPYVDKGTHQELTIVSDIPQGERVEISKTEAAMTLKGWNDEYAITIKPQIPTTALGAIDRDFKVPSNRPLLSKRMEYKSGSVTAFIEPKEGTENEFDIDFMLESKPDTNVFEYKIEGAEEFDFFYQPELTPEDIAEGASRPDNVIGSYAVYHKTKVNNCTNCGTPNYATGKAFHIYRPKAIDANGAEEWAELSYQEGILSVIVSQKFLDDAVYPVRVDPTFGNTTIGASTVDASVPLGITVTSPSDAAGANLDSISAYGNKATAGTTDFVAALYVGGTGSKVLLDQHSAQTSVTNASVQWWVVTMTTYSLSGSTSYNLIGWANPGTGAFRYRYDTCTNCTRNGSMTFPTWDNPETWGGTLDNNLSIYATYTVAAAVTSLTSTSTVNIQGQVNIEGQVEIK